MAHRGTARAIRHRVIPQGEADRVQRGTGRRRSIHRHPGQTLPAHDASDAKQSRKRAQYDLGRRATLRVQIFLSDDHTRGYGAVC